LPEGERAAPLVVQATEARNGILPPCCCSPWSRSSCCSRSAACSPRKPAGCLRCWLLV